jgi:endonuclease YncB( thermonuclease family)
MPHKAKLVYRLSIILLACLFSYFAGQFSRDKNSPTPTHGLHLCSQVADGDTIKAIFRGQTERLRILDIDATEVRRTIASRSGIAGSRIWYPSEGCQGPRQ